MSNFCLCFLLSFLHFFAFHFDFHENLRHCLTLQTSSFSINSASVGRPSLGSGYLFERTNDDAPVGMNVPGVISESPKPEPTKMELKAE
jgi:hypothetical protein